MKGLLISILVVGLAGGALFSISAMDHSHGHTTSNDCPMSPLHTPVCPTGALSVASHYLFMYQAFASGIVSSVVMQVLMAVLLFAVVAYVFRKYIISVLRLFILSRNFGAKLYRPQALIRWLSLLVNSPSFN